MCGIAGILGEGPPRQRIVAAMLDSVAHRGPDGEGLFHAPAGRANHLTFGHRRLSILDLTEAGAQPMMDAGGRFVITYNGEIYNYLEIRAELCGMGATFRSASDTEVILEAYKYWGAQCLSRLNGMFAFALYDTVRGILFCARDRYGEKPFLFSATAGSFAFASEFKALFQDPDISLDIDEFLLLRTAQNPSSGLDASGQTVFKAVQQLMPGEAMEVDVNTLHRRVWRYWQVTPGESADKSDELEVFAEFRALLTDAVRLRMRSDVPVGSCLSGGLDSSAIVCIVRELLGPDAPYNTFTGRFPGTPSDEWEYAHEVNLCTGARAHVVEPTADQFVDELPDFLWHNELPVSSSSQYAQWCVFRLAKENGVTVLLDGQGADEGLAGYEQYFAHYLRTLQDRGDVKRLARELPRIRERYPLALVPAGRSVRDRLPFTVRHWLSGRFDFGTNVLYGIEPTLARRLSEDSVGGSPEATRSLAKALVADSFGGYLTALLRYGDRNSMAHSREVRLPFCDHRIAEFAFRLPPQFLMGDAQTKRLLREAMRGILPDRIRQRWNKQGFRPPQELWLRSPKYLTLMNDALNSASFQQNPLWVSSWWRKALSRANKGDGALGWTLWQPMIIESWRQHFLRRIGDDRQRVAA